MQSRPINALGKCIKMQFIYCIFMILSQFYASYNVFFYDADKILVS